MPPATVDDNVELLGAALTIVALPVDSTVDAVLVGVGAIVELSVVDGSAVLFPWQLPSPFVDTTVVVSVVVNVGNITIVVADVIVVVDAIVVALLFSPMPFLFVGAKTRRRWPFRFCFGAGANGGGVGKITPDGTQCPHVTAQWERRKRR